MRKFLLPFLACVLLVSRISAQSDFQSAVANPVGGNFLSIPYSGQVNLDTGNLMLDIPVIDYPGRGTGSSGLHMTFNSVTWSGAQVQGGWQIKTILPNAVQAVAIDQQVYSCPPNYLGEYYQASRFQAVDSHNTIHTFFMSPVYYFNCYTINGGTYAPPGLPSSGSGTDLEGTGAFLSVQDYWYTTVYLPDGSTNSETPNGNLIGTSLDDMGARVDFDSFSSGDCRAAENTGLTGSSPYSPQAPSTCTYSLPARDDSGATITLTVINNYIPVCTNFYGGQNSYGEYCGGIWIVRSFTLPSGDTYSFQYDEGQAAGHYGTLTSMTLPTGGTISYGYSAADPTFPHFGLRFHSASVSGQAVTVSNPPPPQGYPQVLFPTYPLTVTYPARNSGSPAGPEVDSTTYSVARDSQSRDILTQMDYEGAHAIRTIVRDYSLQAQPSYTETTWLDTNDIDHIDFSYAHGNLIQDKTETANGVLYRSVHTDYLSDTAQTNYNSQYHMFSYPTRVQLKDASGAVAAETDYTYDEYSSTYCSQGPVGYSGVQTLSAFNRATGHDDSRGTSYVARANPTTITRLIHGSLTTTEHRCYDTLGNLTQVVDGNGYPTQFAYDDNFVDSACLTSGAMAHGLRTSVINALGQKTTSSFYSCNRSQKFGADPNDLAASRMGSSTTIDRAGRPLCSSDAAGGSTCISYDSTNQRTISTAVTGSTTHSVTSTLDGYGRSVLDLDNNTNDGVSYSYTWNGRVQMQTPPLPGGGGPVGPWIKVYYDSLGRTIKEVEADLVSTTRMSYTGPNVDVYDPTGSHQYLAYNMLGQLTHVDEDGTTASPFALGTDYTYNVLNNLTDVLQSGATGDTSRSRHYSYDALSRLHYSYNPESGSTCYGTSGGTSPTEAGCGWYGYDANGNLRYKTDANNNVTSYNYDALNRLTRKVFSDGSPQEVFGYDGFDGEGNQISEFGPANSIGRMSHSSNDINSASSFAYDAVGRLTNKADCNPHDCSYTARQAFGYDLAGNMTSIQYADGRVVQQAFDGAGRLQSVTDFTGGTAGTPYFTAQQYTPAGALARASYGNGVSTAYGFNNRLQPCRSDASTSILPTNANGGNLLHRQIFYGATSEPNCGTASNNNGNIFHIIDSLDGLQSQNFGFDGVNRLTSAYSSNRPPPTTYNHTYNYDSFGNMIPQDNLHNNPDLRIDPSTNRLYRYASNAPIYTYDNAGNLTSTGTSDVGGHSFTYNLLNQISTVDGGADSYIYTPTEERASKVTSSGWTDYVYMGGQPMSEHTSDGTWTDYIYANGQKVAKVVSQEPLLHLHMNFAGNGSPLLLAFGGVNVAGLPVQPNDHLAFSVEGAGSVQWGAGGYLTTPQGQTIGTSYTDQNGQSFSYLPLPDNTWQHEIADMSAYAGNSVQVMLVAIQPETQPGPIDVWMKDFAIVHGDGSVTPIATSNEVTLTTVGEAGQVLSSAPQTVNAGTGLTLDYKPLIMQAAEATNYYLDDHLGTTQMELSAGGWPIWQGQFTPFGQELDIPTTAMHYQFTGKERDTETGLDYFGARYYASSMGRFSSPDPSGLYFADPTNPQSLNLYSYARNNPLIGTDPTGMAYCQWDDGTHDDSANTGVEGAVNSGTECTNAGGTWSHDDGLNDDGSQMGSEGKPSLTVTATLVTDTDTTSVTTTGDSYDPDDANLYLLSVGITEDTNHAFGCIAGAYGVGAPSAATGTTGSQVFNASQNLVGKAKAAGAAGSTTFTSEAAMAARASSLGSVKLGFNFPTPVGTPFSGNFAMRGSGTLGGVAGRYAPYAGAAMKVAGVVGTAYSSYKLYNCLGH